MLPEGNSERRGVKTEEMLNGVKKPFEPGVETRLLGSQFGKPRFELAGKENPLFGSEEACSGSLTECQFQRKIFEQKRRGRLPPKRFPEAGDDRAVAHDRALVWRQRENASYKISNFQNAFPYRARKIARSVAGFKRGK